MKAGDVYGGQTSSRESWLSAPLSDPNAALWASITPPANPDLATIVRRRAAAFSLDRLAQRLYLLLPGQFSSRSTARTAILAASVAVGAVLGSVGYLSLRGPQPRAIAALAPAAAEQQEVEDATPPANAARRGETELAIAAGSPANTLAGNALAATAPANAPEQLVQRLSASADATDPGSKPAKAKRAAVKKRSKSTARRSSKRRARAKAL